MPCPKCNKTGHSLNMCPNNYNKQANCAIKSKVNSRGLPIVDALIFGENSISTLIDSGAEQSIIDIDFIPPNIKISKFEVKSLTTIESECKPIRQIDLSVNVGDTYCTFGPVAVIKKPPIPLILGSDWRQATNISILVETNGDIQIIKEENGKHVNADTYNNINGCIMNVIPISLQEEIEYQINHFDKNISNQHINKFREIVKNNIQAQYTTDNTPIRLKPYRYSQADRQFINQTIMEWKKMNIARDSYSEYASPVVIVNQPQHPSTPRRLAIDYTALNKKLKKISFPIPHIDDVIDTLVKPESNFFTVMDVKTMKFGISSAPKTMKRIMKKTFNNTKDTITYMDDVGQSSPDIETALNNFENALQKFISAGLKISLKKCQIMKKRNFFPGIRHIKKRN